MNWRLQKCWAAALLALCLVAACLVPSGTTHFASAEEVCTHENGIFIVTRPATCIEEGYSLYYCPDCGEYYKKDVTGLGDHDYWSVRSVFTEDGELLEDYVQCTVCGHQDVIYYDVESDMPTFDDGLPAANGDSLPGWAIALIVVVVVLFAGGIGVGIFFYMRSQKKNG